MFKMSVIMAGIFAIALGGSWQATDSPKVIAEGDWSTPVADTRGFAVRGRLVLCEKLRSDERREVAIYVELQDARESIGNSMRIYCDMGKIDSRPEDGGGLKCALQDKDKKTVEATSYPFGGAVPATEWVTLPTDATIRLRATPFGIHQAKGMAITPHLGQLWVINDDDPNEYFLSGTFTVDPDAGREAIEDPHIWRGTIVLPEMRIINLRK